MGAGASLNSNTQNPEQQEKETMFPSMMNITEIITSSEMWQKIAKIGEFATCHKS